MSTDKATPLMQQYAVIKEQHPESLLLFQVGDFYELFFDDAKQAAAFLGIALTKRGTHNGEPIPLCGVPVHALDHYLAKLVRGGFKVAICDQLEEAIPGKVVERGVTHVLTPGTLTDTKLLDAKSASYLCTIFPGDEHWGILFGELLTAQLYATVVPAHNHKMLEAELGRFFPDEILLPDIKQAKSFASYIKELGYYTSLYPYITDHDEQAGAARAWLGRQFKHELIAPVFANESVRNALYGFFAFLQKNQEAAVDQFKSIHFYKPDDYLLLDAATQKNLELITSSQQTSANTLFAVLDGAITSMGSRMIKKWLLRPLVKKEAIAQRQDVIHAFINDLAAMQALEKVLQHIGDLERVVGRIALRRAQLHDYLHVAQSLALVPEIRTIIHGKKEIPLLASIEARLGNFHALHQVLVKALNDDTTQEWLIKSGFNSRLDELRDMVFNSQSKILALEQQEQETTGIQSLKIRYNNVHGYYIEITKANLDAVPAHYIRQQTLVGRERYTTPALKVLQSEIILAQQNIQSYEKELFEEVKQAVYNQLYELRHLAQALAHLDALFGLSKVAYEQGYNKPVFNDRHEIRILDGKHPVVAQRLRTNFIPNDTIMNEEQSLWIITGPNMGGKSTYLRQVALMCIMAQCGSYVPAAVADLPILDRIFTRIGAGDNVAEGKSTFLVEMEETALICTQATKNSLVILDEVGRGTSTFDGLAIAQAVVEYIYKHVGARCLFATHYHELTALEEQYPGIVSYHAASKKTDVGILFLYKMMKGAADGSFGLEVAKLAHLPQPIIQRAHEILQQLTSSTPQPLQPIFANSDFIHQRIQELEQQIAIKDALLASLTSVDYEQLSPRQAFDLIWSLKERMTQGQN